MKFLLAALLLLHPAAKAENNKVFTATHVAGYGVGMVDTTLTSINQRNNCPELNPLAFKNPSLRSFEVTGSWGLITYVDSKIRKRHKKLWIILPILAVAGHSYGIYTGVKHYNERP